MKTIFKRFIALISALSCLASVMLFSGCSIVSEKPAMTINNVEISNDVFTYFLDLATVEMGKDASFDALREKAKAYASTYFKTNTLANMAGITLTTAEKAKVSEKVNAYWNIFGSYYTKIGVSKETLTKVFTADSFRSALLLHYYGTGGEEEIPLTRLYAQFKTNYIVFQSITGYFTTTDANGKTVRINENDSEALILKFQNMATMVNAGEQTMEEAADFLASTGYQSSAQTVILHKDDTSYPAGFFQKVQATEARLATVIGTNDYIFLVLRGDADTNSEYFKEKKPEMIEIIVGDEIDEKIENSLATNIKVTNDVAKGYYNLIMNEKGA